MGACRALAALMALTLTVSSCSTTPPVTTPSPLPAVTSDPPTSPVPVPSDAEPSANATPTGPPSPAASASDATACPLAEPVAIAPGEEWLVFQSLTDQFGRERCDDGVDHDDTIFLARPDGTGVHRLVPDEFVGSEIRPTWSPDGGRIAFLRARFPDDHGELWTINADGSGAERLYTCVGPNVPATDCNSIGDPDWSPDGGAIYFARDSNPPPEPGPPLTFEIWRYDLATGEAGPALSREDGMTVEQPRLSPDGRQVVYVRYRNLDGPVSDSALFIADLATGEERRITDWDLQAAYPDWSVDDRIAFNSWDLRAYPDTTEAVNIYSIAVDGSDLRQLTNYRENDTRATQPRWTADGSGIVYTLVSRVAGDPFGERRLAFLPAAGTDSDSMEGTNVIGTHPELRPPETSGPEASPSATAAQTIPLEELEGRILFGRMGGAYGDATIFTANADGTDDQRVGGYLADKTTCCPRWLSDGLRLAFGALTDDGHFTTGLMQSDGSGFEMFELEGTFEGGCTVPSRGTERMACEAHHTNDPTSTGIYTVRASDGSDPRPVIRDIGMALPMDFSPDGGQIVFIGDPVGPPTGVDADAPVGSLFVVNIDGTGLKRITPDGVYALFSSRWSPDGEWILFAGLGRTRDPVWAVRPDGSDLRVVYQDESRGAVHPSWSPDGDFILFGLDPPGTQATLTDSPPNELCVIRADGSDLTCIIRSPDHKIWTDWAAP